MGPVLEHLVRLSSSVEHAVPVVSRSPLRANNLVVCEHASRELWGREGADAIQLAGELAAEDRL
jgi:hypothetical protein